MAVVIDAVGAVFDDAVTDSDVVEVEGGVSAAADVTEGEIFSCFSHLQTLSLGCFYLFEHFLRRNSLGSGYQCVGSHRLSACYVLSLAILDADLNALWCLRAVESLETLESEDELP